MARRRPARAGVPGQVVLVLQGGGALGAYQVGVYEAMHEAGIEPDWVIGTSIGAINAALIAGNAPEDRMHRFTEFWARVEQGSGTGHFSLFTGLSNVPANLTTVINGIPAFFRPNPIAWISSHSPLGIENAAYYTVAPLPARPSPTWSISTILSPHGSRDLAPSTSGRGNALLRQPRRSRSHRPRTRFGRAAAGVPRRAYRRRPVLGWRHLFEHADRGGARRQAAPGLGDFHGTHVESRRPRVPTSLWQVMGRQKDIQYASRAKSHIARQKQIHHLRHIIREIAKHVPEKTRNSAAVKELASWGCNTTMHVARLIAPQLEGEDHTKDIDFTPAGIARAGRRATPIPGRRWS